MECESPPASTIKLIFHSEDEIKQIFNNEVAYMETGITRPVDKLGRIVIPKEVRDMLRIERDDCLEIFIEDDKIILRKYDKENMLL